MFLKNLADAFSFFAPFEKNLSFYYLFVFLLSFIYLLSENRRRILDGIKKNFLLKYLFVILLLTLLILAFFSPFADTNDSRSEDYKLAAKYYAENQRYTLCKFGNSTQCFVENRMEKAPGYPFLLSIFYIIFHPTSINASIFNFIIALFSPLLVFIIIYAATKRSMVSLLASLLFAAHPEFVEYATKAEVINITIFFVLVSFLFIQIYYKSKNGGILVLSAYALLFLAYMRAEYLILLFAFLLFNFKDAKDSFKKQGRYFLGLFFMMVLFLILHSFTEMIYHTSPEGTYLSLNLITERIAENSGLVLFFAIFFMPFAFFAFDRKNKTRSLEFYALMHVFIFAFLIASFQAKMAWQMYFNALLPSFFIIIGVGSSKFLKSEILKKKEYLKIVIAAIAYLSIFLLMLSGFNFKRIGLNDYSTDNFDYLIKDIEGDIVITGNRALSSRAILETSLTAANLQDFEYPEKIKEILNSQSYKKKYFFKIAYGYHDSLVFDNFNTKLIAKKGEVELYEISA